MPIDSVSIRQPTSVVSPPARPSVRHYTAGWGDMDFNGHMRNTAYLDKAADARLQFFAEHGFPMRELQRLGFGPVMQRDCIAYFREVHLLQVIAVSTELAGLSADGSRFVIRNRFQREDGALLACVDSTGGWLDLRERRLRAPPAALLAALRGLPHAADFEPLDSAIRQPG